MEMKTTLVRWALLANNFIGAFAGLLSAIGLFNVFTDSSVGLASRGNYRHGGLALTTPGEVFIAILVVVAALAFYFGLEKIREQDYFGRLFAYVMNVQFTRFMAYSMAFVFIVSFIFSDEEAIGELLIGSALIGGLGVFHAMVYAVAYAPGMVASSLVQHENQSKRSDDVAERLKKLDGLLSNGTITEAEYKQKRDEILRDL
jgi:hypothetical protein